MALVLFFLLNQAAGCLYVGGRARFGSGRQLPLETGYWELWEPQVLSSSQGPGWLVFLPLALGSAFRRPLVHGVGAGLPLPASDPFCPPLPQEAYNAVVRYFGESPKTTPPSVFFPVFVRFIRSYKVSCR